MQPENLNQETIIKTSAKSSVGSAILGVVTSITNMVIQILLIYWILSAFGTEFNGFVRISMSVAIVGGTAEGALGITTVLLLAKPIMEKDWISANEIYSTSRRKYRNKFWRGMFFITLISILYPLELALAPVILQNDPAQTIITTPKNMEIHLWELAFVSFFFGFKQVISSSFFGIYENILEADKQNYLRRSVILFTDVLVYTIIILLLNVVNYSDGWTISPIVVFLPIVIYPIIRGYMIRWYVKTKYPWIRFYSDFNDHNIVRKSSRLFFSSLGINILTNSDIIILFVVMGASGLKVTSMLSIYMIIGVNLRIIMLNFVVSFREYFILQIVKEGRIQWKTYTNYELYTYIVAGFTFVVISILTPFIASGLFGTVIQNDFNSTTATLFEAQALKYIFSSNGFSIIFALTTSAIIIVQGQYVLIQAKGVEKRITKLLNWYSIFFVAVTSITLFLMYTFTFNRGKEPNWTVSIIKTFYIMKASFMLIAYFFLWSFTWKYVTYNSSTKNVFSNFLFLTIPIVATAIFIEFGLSKFALNTVTIKEQLNSTATVEFSQISVATLVSILAIVAITSLPVCVILPLIFRPKVGLNVITNLPIVKQIIEKKFEKSKISRFIDAGINVEEDAQQTSEVIKNLYERIESDTLTTENSRTEKRYNYINTPKTYIITSKEKTTGE